MLPVLIALALSQPIDSQKVPCPGAKPEPPLAMAGLSVCPSGILLPDEGTDERGVLVAALEPEHRLATTGLRAGDVLYKIADQRVETGHAALERLKALEGAQEILINFRRNGAPLLVRVGRGPSSASPDRR